MDKEKEFEKRLKEAISDAYNDGFIAALNLVKTASAKSIDDLIEIFAFRSKTPPASPPEPSAEKSRSSGSR